MEEFKRLSQALLQEGSFASRAVAAIGIALVTWIVARLVRKALTRLLITRGVDVRLQHPGFSAAMANIVYGLVWLFALPALLGTLQLDGLLAPVNAMMSRMLGFVPSIMGAAAVFAIGFLVAQIARQIVSGLLMAAGSEALADRLGLKAALGDKTLGGLMGSVLFAFILMPTLAAALQTLGLEVIAVPVTHLLEQIMNMVPRLMSAAVIVGITALLGRTLASLTGAICAGMGANRLPVLLGIGQGDRIGGRSMSEHMGTVVMMVILFVGVTQASEVLGFAILTQALTSLGMMLAKIASGLVIMAGGAWLATLASKAVMTSGKRHARRLAQATRACVLFFAGALALHQAGLPSEIITIAFASVVGSLGIGLAVGLAIAIGTGGRSTMTRLFERTFGASGMSQAPDVAPQQPDGRQP